AAVFLDAQHHLSLELVEPLGAFFPVVVGARIGAADHHDDEVAVVDALVADRGLEQVAVVLDPLLEVERGGDHGRCLAAPGPPLRQQADAGQGGTATAAVAAVARGGLATTASPISGRPGRRGSGPAP